MPNGVWNDWQMLNFGPRNLGTIGQGDNTKLSEDQKKLPVSKSALDFMGIWSNSTSPMIGGSDWPPPVRPSSTE